MTDSIATPDVLLIEDEETDAAIVRRTLSDDYDVEVLTDGGTAISAFRSFDRGAASPDLVLLDQNLPRWSGFDVLAAMRTIPALQEVPTVVLSSSDDETDRERAQTIGADRFVTKPMDIEDFDRKLVDIERTFLQKDRGG